MQILLPTLTLCAAAAEPTEVGTSDVEPAEEARWAAIAAPLIAYDSNLLLGLGAFGQAVRGDPTGELPFRFSLFLQLYGTTGGYQDHFLAWDIPGVGGSPVRWWGRARYQSWNRARYFGIGNDTPLEADFADRVLWNSRRPIGLMGARISLGQSAWDAYVVGLAQLQTVLTYPDTLLVEQQPVGVEGGLLSLWTAGMFHDTRDNEIHPTRGHALDLAVYGSAEALGSSWTYAGGHVALQGFVSPSGSLVVAGNVLGEAASADEPFFRQGVFDGLSYGNAGGRILLRGLSEGRILGHGLGAIQGELRWTWARSTWFRTVSMHWMLVPFVDTAQVWSWDLPATLDPHVTGGAGLRVNVNELLVLRGDVGVGIERYVDDPGRRPQLQVYLLSDHPF